MDHETLLLKIESSKPWMAGMPSGNVLAFFRGAVLDAKAAIQIRLKEVLELNPWLVGRLYKTSKGFGVCLGWSDEALSDELKAIDSDTSSIFHVTPAELKSKVHSNQSYAELSRILLRSPYAVPVGNVCLKNNLPLFSVTLIEVDKENFAVHIAISHIIADGYTGYAIGNMVLSAKPALAMDPKRDHSFDEKLAAVLGEKEKSILDFSLPGILNTLGKHLFLPRPKAYFFNLNVQAIEDEKRKFRLQAGQSTSAFVSTNDILCTTLSDLMGLTSLYMAVNFRGRLNFTVDTMGQSTGELLAGNYESGILFFEGDFDKPEKIRYAQGQGKKGLYQRAPNADGQASAIPGFWKRTFGRPGIITNWSGWDANLTLPNCELVLFVPLNDIDKPFLESAIVFQPRPKEVGVLVFSRQIKDLSQIQNFSPIFGAAINDTLFPPPQ